MNQERIQLLSDEEIDAIYAIPIFNEAERTLYFELNECEKLLSKKYRTVKAQIYFIRMLGYFKAKQQWYRADLLKVNPKDTQHIMEKYFSTLSPLSSGEVDAKTYKKIKEDLLTALGYQNWSTRLTGANVQTAQKYHGILKNPLFRIVCLRFLIS